jgi:hypothetical protein
VVDPEGEPVVGRIESTEANYSVQVNGRNPWTIAYRYHANGQDYEGKVTTLQTPGEALQAGCEAVVLYLPSAPQFSSLYPHP